MSRIEVGEEHHAGCLQDTSLTPAGDASSSGADHQNTCSEAHFYGAVQEQSECSQLQRDPASPADRTNAPGRDPCCTCSVSKKGLLFYVHLLEAFMDLYKNPVVTLVTLSLQTHEKDSGWNITNLVLFSLC